MPESIDKAALLNVLQDRVAADLEAVVRRQRDAQAGSTHEESRAEHAKDTRATEQSYLARGLAERVEALSRMNAAVVAMRPRAFEQNEPAAVTAIVVLDVVLEALSTREDGDAERQIWWLVAGAGGFELEQNGEVIRTVTPVSPLGRALTGLHVGDEGGYRTPRGERSFEVIAIR